MAGRQLDCGVNSKAFGSIEIVANKIGLGEFQPDHSDKNT